jgi:capsular polysaccharide transport system permease protein
VSREDSNKTGSPSPADVEFGLTGSDPNMSPSVRRRPENSPAGRDSAAERQLLAVGRISARVAGKPRRIQQRLSVTEPRRMQLTDANTGQYYLPPSGKGRRSYLGYIGFGICVIVPVMIATIYYGFLASKQYVAEFRFSVQDASSTATQVPTGLSAILGSSAGSSSNNNYLVTDYLTSREAIDQLQRRIDLIKLYSKPDIDWWARFNSSKPLEKFVSYWQSMVTANFDQVTGLATTTVRAFSPQDALLVANTMVKLSEDLVNEIASRSQRDAVVFAENEVTKAQARLKENRAKLQEYRNRVGVIDPTTSVTVSNSTLVQSQRAALAQLETQLATFLRQNLSPDAPAVVTLKNQIKSTKDQLAATEGDVARGINGAALSKVVGEYEQVNLEVQFAQTMLTSTMQALDQARANAASQHLYITPYVRPALPQSSTYPNVFLSILTVAAVSLAIWFCGMLLTRSVRERYS